MTYEEVRAIVLSCLAAELARAGYDLSAVADDLDLLQEGIVDSFGFINLIEEVEECLDVAIDIRMLDDEAMTTLGGFIRKIAATRS